MNALSSQVQAERMRLKEKKAKKVNKPSKLTRTNSNGGSEPSSETKVEPTTPTQVGPPEGTQEQKEEEEMEGEGARRGIDGEYGRLVERVWEAS